MQKEVREMIDENGHRFISEDKWCIYCRMNYSDYRKLKEKSEKQGWRQSLKDDLKCKDNR